MYNQTRSFNLGIAIDISIEAALIYDDLAYAQHTFGEGKWFYRSYKQLTNRFPMMSESTIRRTIRKLEEAGWVVTKVKKIEGAPTLHFQIDRNLVTVNGTETMESVNGTETIYKEETTKETTKNSTLLQNERLAALSFGEKRESEASAASSDSSAVVSITTKDILHKLLRIINPRERPTADRIRMLNARLKDYTVDELIAAARVFSRSEWHLQNKQMSIDNLLAPSKFGRWHQQASTEWLNSDKVKRQQEIENRLEAEAAEIRRKAANA